MTKTSEKTKVCFTLRLSPEIRKQFKVRCAELEVSMEQKIVDLMKQELKK